MPKRKQIRFVIDTDITSAASEKSCKLPTNCRIFLQTMMRCGHCIVFTPDLQAEWRRRRSGWSRRWRSYMHGMGLVHDIRKDCRDKKLREKIKRFASEDESQRDNLIEDMLKDVHLLEAALITDKRIASRNDTQREDFARASRSAMRIGMIKKIMWVNPAVENEYCLNWLKKGAPVEPERQLGYLVSR
ncbi:MAG: hypothetical protein OXG02_05690 [Chloroflexi bacterium]|nr:hypothetical protein [Chloroflexota bacterium]